VYAAPSVVGKHWIYDLQGGDHDLLNDEDFVKDVMTMAAEAANATLLSISTKKFDPQGVTAVALLSESHLSIQPGPNMVMPPLTYSPVVSVQILEPACDFLRKSFKATHGSIQILKRVCPNASLLRLQGVVP
jgi:S-adenosylmethionine decarboxylase